MNFLERSGDVSDVEYAGQLAAAVVLRDSKEKNDPKLTLEQKRILQRRLDQFFRLYGITATMASRKTQEEFDRHIADRREANFNRTASQPDFVVRSASSRKPRRQRGSSPCLI